MTYVALVLVAACSYLLGARHYWKTKAVFWAAAYDDLLETYNEQIGEAPQ